MSWAEIQPATDWKGARNRFRKYTGKKDVKKSLLKDTTLTPGDYEFFWAWGTTLVAAVNCPANCTCGVTASPLTMEVIGKETIHLCGSRKSDDKTYPCTDPAPAWCPRETFNRTVEEYIHFRGVSTAVEFLNSSCAHR